MKFEAIQKYLPASGKLNNKKDRLKPFQKSTNSGGYVADTTKSYSYLATLRSPGSEYIEDGENVWPRNSASADISVSFWRAGTERGVGMHRTHLASDSVLNFCHRGGNSARHLSRGVLIEPADVLGAAFTGGEGWWDYVRGGYSTLKKMFGMISCMEVETAAPATLRS